MNFFQQIEFFYVHWALGLAVLVGLVASEFSGPATLLGLPIAAISITLSALCNSSMSTSSSTGACCFKNRKRRLCDILQFFKMWVEILEILAVSATCARIASATVDYISNERTRDWFLGLESHSLGEPWPDILGVSVMVVITGLFMLGLERSTSFAALLFLSIVGTLIFFLSVGGSHTVINPSKWAEAFKTSPIHSVLTAATLCSYGFPSTFPKSAIIGGKVKTTFTVLAFVAIPLSMYASVVVVFTMMSHYKELTGTATPLLRIFEIRDVDWARPVMAACLVSIVCLALTEILPSLYGLFVILATKEWQIFISSLQYRSSFTGAPMLAIFAAGSLAAILAFACPLAYLVKILNLATLLKCILVSLQVLHQQYRPGDTSGSYLVTTTQYSKLGPSSSTAGVFSNWKTRNAANRKIKAKNVGDSDNECLLMDDYLSPEKLKINCHEIDDDSDLEEPQNEESVLSGDSDDSSTDIDAVVEEYRDKIRVATIDNFPSSRKREPTWLSGVAVIIFLMIIIISSICISQRLKPQDDSAIMWLCLIFLIVAILLVLLMPRTATSSLLIPISALLSLVVNIILATTIVAYVWPGYVFWLCAGAVLFWRCDCCTCEGLLVANNQVTSFSNINYNCSNQLNIRPNITENVIDEMSCSSSKPHSDYDR